MRCRAVGTEIEHGQPGAERVGGVESHDAGAAATDIRLHHEQPRDVVERLEHLLPEISLSS